MSFVPILNLPFLYINNMQISNNAIAPNTKIDVAAGQCRDSTNVYDIVSSALTINAAVNGVNGLDTGSFAATKCYYVFAIMDASGQYQPAGLISLSKTAPYLPAGYSNFRWIGQMFSDGSTHFLLGYNYGSEGDRLFMYDAPRASSITAGNATSYTAVDLSQLVPAVDNLPLILKGALTPGAAGRGLYLQPSGATGDAVIILGQVTSVVVNQNVEVMAKLVSSAPKVGYKVSNSGDAAAINVCGFRYSL